MESKRTEVSGTRSAMSAVASQATSNQPKNEISGKMLQENQAELTAQNADNINPLQREIKLVSEKNPQKRILRRSGRSDGGQLVSKVGLFLTLKELAV